MTIERIMAESHLQNICNAGRALALTAGRVDDLRADVAYLLNRAGNAGHYKYDPGRDFGASSNALVAYAYTGIEPTEWPKDRSDYAACVRAVRKMPRHRRTPEVMLMLGKAKQKYADSPRK